MNTVTIHLGENANFLDRFHLVKIEGELGRSLLRAQTFPLPAPSWAEGEEGEVCEFDYSESEAVTAAREAQGAAQCKVGKALSDDPQTVFAKRVRKVELYSDQIELLKTLSDSLDEIVKIESEETVAVIGPAGPAGLVGAFNSGGVIPESVEDCPSRVVIHTIDNGFVVKHQLPARPLREAGENWKSGDDSGSGQEAFMEAMVESMGRKRRGKIKTYGFADKKGVLELVRKITEK